ncbi:MAG: hypothetical protein ACXACA_02895 [Candidatus Ranarchaeia archaeon]
MRKIPAAARMCIACRPQHKHEQMKNKIREFSYDGDNRRRFVDLMITITHGVEGRTL